MARLRNLLIAFGLVAMLMVVPAGNLVRAQVPGGPFATSFTIQNLANAVAQCTYQVYSNAGGTPAFTSPVMSIAANDSVNVYTPSVPNFPVGQFAGVVSCDQQVAVVVNFSDPDKGDTYRGIDNPANVLFVPAVYNDYFNYYTTLRIQNTSATEQEVTVEYFDPAVVQPVDRKIVIIKANGSADVNQAGLPGLARNKSYSAKITGNAPLGALIQIYGKAGSGVAKQLYSTAALTAGSTSPSYQPVILRDYFGYNTATVIQNVGTAPTDVKLTYSNGTVKQYSLLNAGAKLAPNSSWVVLDFQEPTLLRNTLYGSKVETIDSQPLIVIVNESTPTTSRAANYVGQSAGGTTLVMPIVTRRYFGYNSGASCQNIGNVATDVKVSFTGGGPQAVLLKAALAPGAVVLMYAPAIPGLAEKYIGSAIVTSTAAPIICVANQDANEAPNVTIVRDQFQSYAAVVKS